MKKMMLLRYNWLFVTGLFLILNFQAFAQPSNDNCSGAITLTVSSSCTPVSGDVAGATQSPTTPCGSESPEDDVWYQFTATDYSHGIAVTGSSSFDAVIEVYNACGTGLVECTNYTSAGQTESMTITTVLSNQYYIRVYDAGATVPATTTFSICVTPIPANDICSAAISLIPGSSCNTVTGDVLGASGAGVVSGCTGYADDDLWYKFVATTSNPGITVTGSTYFDAVVQLLSSCSVGITCTDATTMGGIETINATGLTSGNTYYIRVFHYAASGPGSTTFTICVTSGPATTGTLGKNLIENSLEIYPNPSNSLVTLSFDADPDNLYSIKLLGSDGSMVYSKEVSGSGNIKDMIDTESFPKGIYLLQIRTKEEIVGKKLILN
jgi:hypothetical protein